MIIKSYEIQKKTSNFLKYNLFLLYGENYGLKKDIKESIKIEVNKQNVDIELLSLYESDIINNEEIFYNSIYSGSLFSNKKLITISNGTDKIIKQVDAEGKKSMLNPDPKKTEGWTTDGVSILGNAIDFPVQFIWSIILVPSGFPYGTKILIEYGAGIKSLGI